MYHCGNVQSVDDATANIINAARLAGKLKFKIKAYASADYSGTPVVHEQYAKKDLFTTTTGTAAITNSGMSITAADLGSNSVRFAGPVRDLSIGVITPTTNAQGNSRWGEDSTAGLAGVVTVAKANARCLTNSGPHSCDYTYGSTAVINRITLNKRDAQGRGLWVTYFTNGGIGIRAEYPITPKR